MIKNRDFKVALIVFTITTLLLLMFAYFSQPTTDSRNLSLTTEQDISSTHN